MDNQEPSTSLSLFTKQQEMGKIEDGEEVKKLKNEDDFFIDNLPPEMQMEILKYLDIKSLLFFRLVNRKWSGIATEILKTRDDVEIMFYYDKYQRQCSVGKYWTKSVPLVDFMDCFKNSKSFPYTRFLVCVGKDSVLLDDENWNKFISDFGENIKCLKLRTQLYSDNDLIKFTEKLKFLLVSQLPKLEELGLDFYYKPDKISMASSIQLFPANPSEQAISIRLPYLKVLHLLKGSLWEFTKIFTDLLVASANLQKIEPSAQYCSFSFENLYLLQSAGKLDCLQTAKIFLNTEFLSQLKKAPGIPLGFKLKKLNLHVKSLYNEKNSWTDAAVVVSNIFESSKSTLRKLETDQLGFLSGLQLPIFSNLTNLSVERGPLGKKSTVFPPGSNLTDIFPVLQFLELKHSWTNCFPHSENIHYFPKLKSLEIPGLEVTQQEIVQISEVYPNLKKFAINHNFYCMSIDTFLKVGPAIWTHLKQLETLHLKIDVDSSTKAFPAVDSCFTGFSEEDCIRLWDLMTIEKLSEKWDLKLKIPKSKFEVERKNPSILDLKDLRNLRFDLVLKKPKKEENSDADLDKNSLAVCKKYALQLMQNLKFNIEKSFY